MKRLDPRRLTLGLCAVGMAAVVAFHAVDLWRSYQLRLMESEAFAQTTARALADQFAGTMRVIDAGLIDLSVRLSGRELTDPAARSAVHDALVDWQLRSPATLAFWVTDQEGLLRMTSSVADPPPVDLLHRDSVSRALAGEAGLIIDGTSVGIFNLSRGRPIINLARGVAAPDATVNATVAATVSVDHLVEQYRAMPMPPGSVISVLTVDGAFLARMPWDDRFVGLSMADDPLVQDLLPARDSGVFRRAYPTDGVHRLAAFDTIEDLGVVVLVGLATDQIMAPWRNRLIWSLAQLALVLAVLAGLTAAALRSFARWQQGMQEREQRQRAIARIGERLIGSTTPSTLLETLVQGAREMLPGVGVTLEPAGAAPAGLQPRATDGLATLLPLDAAPGRSAGALRLQPPGDRPLGAEDAAVAEQIARIAATTLQKLQLLDDRHRALQSVENSRRELAQSHARIEAIFNSISDAVYSIDRDGRFTYVNAKACELLRRSAEEMIGQNIWVAFPAAAETALRETCEAAIASGQDRSLEFFYPPLDTWFAVRAFPHDDGLTAYFQDITKRIQADAELRQAQKMDAIGQLTGGVAHDFNNLLTVILGNLEMLAESPGLDANDREAVTLATRASEQAAQLTAHLLAFARRQPLAPRPVDVSQLVQDWQAVLSRTLGPGIQIETAFEGDLPAAQVDPVQLQNALLNLALNARDAMKGEGRLRIGVRQRRGPLTRNAQAEHAIQIEVADTGRGMSIETKERAFDPFFTTKGQGQGSGLGLAMVYGFARQSGGHVLLDSVEGQGTTVTLLLPVAKEPARTASAGQTTRPPRGSERVLVVEDEPAVADWLHRALASLGYEVHVSNHANEALQKLQSLPSVDLMLTDIGLAGGPNGLDLATAAKGQHPKLRILFASGNAAAALAADARLPDNAHFLQKPIHLQDLAKAVRHCLDAAA